MIGFIILLLILLYFGVVGYCWYRLQKTVYIHAADSLDTPEKYRLLFEPISFTTQDNFRLSGWFIPVVNPKAVVILVHGRSVQFGGKSTMIDHALYLYENGYSTFLFDLRGFGESQGNIIGFAEKEWKDVVAAYQYVKSRKENENKKIGFLGISTGASAVCIAAGKEEIGDFVILSTPFASHLSLFAKQVAKEKVFPKFIFTYGLFVASFFVLGLDFFLHEAGRYVAQVKAPILLISAKKDETVNVKDAWKLYEKAHKPKEYWEASTGHDVFKESKEEFQNKILRFLQIYV